jgi:hypothetical protein
VKTPRRIAAYHEAGHAVAREVLRRERGNTIVGVDYVEVDDLGRGACVPINVGEVTWYRPDVERAFIFTLAGPIAESCASGEHLDHVFARGGAGDLLLFEELHSNVQWGNTYEHDLVRYATDAAELLNVHSDALADLAEWLAICGRLDGDSVRAFLA